MRDDPRQAAARHGGSATTGRCGLLLASLLKLRDGHARPCRPERASTYNRSTRRRNPRTSRKSASDWRCSSQATQVFSRSAGWIFGLFQTTAYAAAARQPFAEQITNSFIRGIRLPARQ
jgi:hypothetical protein